MHVPDTRVIIHLVELLDCPHPFNVKTAIGESAEALPPTLVQPNAPAGRGQSLATTRPAIAPQWPSLWNPAHQSHPLFGIPFVPFRLSPRGASRLQPSLHFVTNGHRHRSLSGFPKHLFSCEHVHDGRLQLLLPNQIQSSKPTAASATASTSFPAATAQGAQALNALMASFVRIISIATPTASAATAVPY